ncbi:MAG: hypothetical protein M0P69_12245 [Bacteroidales bacterium]|nr:hypothetical protein [Bacteroidales bacterium]
MTVTSQTNKAIYTCDGSTTIFPYTFKIFEDSDLEVILYTIADGTETTLTLTTDYTVSDAGEDSGGNVTTVLTYSSDYKLILRRGLDYTQETDYVENDPFPADTHEAALDKLTMLVQQLKEVVDRAIVQDAAQSTDLEFPAASSGAFLGWNADADALENKTEPSSLPAATDEAILYGSGTAWAKGSVDGTTVELASGVLGIKDGGVDTTQLAADAVDGTKIADDAVDGDKVANDLLNDFTLKETPVLADSVAIVDSEASNVNKKATLTTIRTTMGLPTQAYSWFDDAANTVTKNLIAIDQDAFFIVEISVGHHDGAVISNNHAYKKYAVWTSSYLTGNAAIEEVDSKVAGAGSIALAVDGSYVKATINNGEFNTIGSIYVKGYNGTIESF